MGMNALQEAPPENVLLQEATPSRPLAAPSRPLAAPMGGGAGMPANMDTLSGCSIQQLRHLASEHRVDIHGLTDKHELVNALQEAVPEALLLQEAAPSRPLAAPSQALAAPTGGGVGMPANMSLVHPGMRQNRLALGAGIPEPALDG